MFCSGRLLAVGTISQLNLLKPATYLMSPLKVHPKATFYLPDFLICKFVVKLAGFSVVRVARSSVFYVHILFYRSLFFLCLFLYTNKDEFEDTIGIIRIRKSKDRQYNGIKEKDKEESEDTNGIIIIHKSKKDRQDNDKKKKEKRTNKCLKIPKG
jgi:hypothetical protein